MRDIPMSEKADVNPPVQIIPNGVNQIFAIPSAHAPLLYFDRASTYGAKHSILNVTLEADRYTVDEAGASVPDRVVVAHLRMTVPAASSLKAAIEAALLLAQPTGPKSP
jgi:hypothetical protein